MKKGAFIVFEGIDGSGKSTQSQMLTERLKKENIECYATREPTDSPIGSLIRNIMTGRFKTDNKVIGTLFVADRLDHLLNDTDGICKKIDSGITVVSDRYYFSSYAYHSVDMDMDYVISANSINADILRPTCTVFVDISEKEAMKRINANRFSKELFETEDRLKSVREAYFKAFDKVGDKENIIIVNGTKNPQELSHEIWEKVKVYL